MLDPKQIKTWIAAGLACEHIEVVGDGQHFEALVVSREFVGQGRVQRQQRINTLLKDRFDSGELHALTMQTLTPEEWNARG